MTRWKVGLSNGETFTEGNKPFDVVAGENSPWLKLLQYCKDKNLDMTSLCLVIDDRTLNLPSAGKNPKSAHFNQTNKPLGYDFGRPFAMEDGKITEIYARIQAIYKDYTLEIWVDEKNTNNSWVSVK